MPKPVILKFGGTSVGTPEMIRKVGEIVKKTAINNQVIVVVSAFAGVTNALIALDKTAEEKQDYQTLLGDLQKRHFAAAENLFPNNTKAKTKLEILFQQLDQVLQEKNHSQILPSTFHFNFKLLNKTLLEKNNQSITALILSFGEKLSATIVSDYLWQITGKGTAIYADTSGIVITDSNFQNANINFEKTNTNINRLFENRIENELFVVTGFISSNEEKETTTLGRGGSDYTAAIIGAALDAERIEIWTDVDGIMNADPKIVKNATLVPRASYEEAIEAAYFGAKVIYPATMLPAMQKGIPILIKNTFNPQSPGTLISGESEKGDSPVKIITAIDNVTLINIKGVKLQGIPGTAAKVFAATRDANVNVILISQASSEHTICLAIKSEEADKCANALKNQFVNDLQNGTVKIEIRPDQTILAAVGDSMKGTPGVTGKISTALGKNNINISAVAQGSSEINISFVIDSRNKTKALNVVHHACVRDGEKNIFLIGTGNIGSQVAQKIRELKNPKIKIVGVINTRVMTYNENGIGPLYSPSIGLQTVNNDWNTFQKMAKESPLGGEKILVDCTSSEKIAQTYFSFAETGFHIVTPSKIFNSTSTLHDYQKLRSIMKKTGQQFLYSASVGAGLPVISTIKNLMASGETIKRLEGVFSGTLSYIFNNLRNGVLFTAVLKQAQQLGLTEPDPQEDLRGKDVARKIITLEREIGWEKEKNTTLIQNLVTMANLILVDKYFQQLVEKAQKRNCVLQYVASITKTISEAGMKEIDKNSPMSNLQDNENIFLIYTEERVKPITIIGEGAGGEITASSVISDILKI